MSNTQTSVSFANDIVPIFYQFQKQMIWRFDLCKYEDVKINYDAILGRITSKDSPMPPAPFPPLTAAQIQTFKDWKAGGFQP